MMSIQPKKKTLAQLRAEKEQHEQDLVDGMRLAMDVTEGYARFQKSQYTSLEVPRYDGLNTFLVQANRAYEHIVQRPVRCPSRHGPLS